MNIEKHLASLLTLLVDFKIRHIAIVYSFKAPNDDKKLGDTYINVEIPIDLNNPSSFIGQDKVSVPGNLSGGVRLSTPYSRDAAILAVVKNKD